MNPVQAPQCADTWRPAQLSMPLVEQGDTLRMSDTGLSQGAWPRAAVTEIVTAHQGFSVLNLLMPVLSQLSRKEKRWICWVAPPWFPDTQALPESDIDLSRVLLVHPKAHQEGLQLVEQVLGSGKCSAVLAWPTCAGAAWLRRLHVAAETGDTLGFLLRFQALDG